MIIPSSVHNDPVWVEDFEQDFRAEQRANNEIMQEVIYDHYVACLEIDKSNASTKLDEREIMRMISHQFNL